jgi:hypothetical protein
VRTWTTRLLLLLALIALGLWGWRSLNPDPERVIRHRLGELARTASFSAKEGLVAQAWNANTLGDFFTLDVQVSLDAPGVQHSLSGRAELVQAYMGARAQVRGLSIEFPDIKVMLDPEGNSAVVNLTAKGKVTGESELYLQELKLRLIKVKRDWLIEQIETVRTLS